MKDYLILLPIFLFAVLQVSFLPINLVLLAVFLWFIVKPNSQRLVIIFLGGLVLDLASGGALGSSSLILLFFTGFLLLYFRRFDPNHTAFLVLFFFFSGNLYHFFVYRYWDFSGGIVLAILAVVTKVFLSLFFRMYSQKEILLKK